MSGSGNRKRVEASRNERDVSSERLASEDVGSAALELDVGVRIALDCLLDVEAGFFEHAADLRRIEEIERHGYGISPELRHSNFLIANVKRHEQETSGLEDAPHFAE